MQESKIDLTKRLMADGRWAEASAWKDNEIRRLRANGIRAKDARHDAWTRLSHQFPPLCPSTAIPGSKDEDAEFVASLEGLPAAVALDTEVDWVAAHPAMSRPARKASDSHKLLLTADDVKHAPHGPAPSRRAVNSLQHWVNAPAGFFNAIASEHKACQRGADGRFPSVSQGAIVDDDLDALQQLLNQMRD
ncbi:MAG: hypothetical protein KDA61_21910 [Planctomycetales bacterium]|nr:hypothetical protein [Planctomycetales bacterium]